MLTICADVDSTDCGRLWEVVRDEEVRRSDGFRVFHRNTFFGIGNAMLIESGGPLPVNSNLYTKKITNKLNLAFCSFGRGGQGIPDKNYRYRGENKEIVKSHPIVF